VARSLHNLGVLQQAQGNYAEALRLYEQSLKVKEALGDKAGVAISLGQLGKLAQDQGRHREAMAYYLPALALFQALNSPYAQLARRDLASIQIEVGEAQFAAWWQELTIELGQDMGQLRLEDIPIPQAQPHSEAVSLDQLLQQIVEATIWAITQGDPAQRQQLWQQLNQLRDQAAGEPELSDLVTFLDAVCQWLEGGQVDRVELASPFAEAWQRLQAGLRSDTDG
jgi:tetratricopeptide (TPR) repeat protein